MGFGHGRAARRRETRNLRVQPVLSKAGERIRTVDIHVGNVTDAGSQTLFGNGLHGRYVVPRAGGGVKLLADEAWGTSTKN